MDYEHDRTNECLEPVDFIFKDLLNYYIIYGSSIEHPKDQFKNVLLKGKKQ